MQLSVAPRKEAVIPDESVAIVEPNQGHEVFLALFEWSGQYADHATGRITVKLYIPQDALLVSKVAE